MDPSVPSPAPGARRSVPMLTKARLLRERAQRRKRNLAKRLAEERQTGKKVRGRWSSPGTFFCAIAPIIYLFKYSVETKRQSSGAAGSGFDGSQGVDSGDIGNIPTIGFSTL